MTVFPYTASGPYALVVPNADAHIGPKTHGTYTVDTEGTVTQVTTGY